MSSIATQNATTQRGTVARLSSSAELRLRERWYPVAMDFWIAWKEYTCFDATSDADALRTLNARTTEEEADLRPPTLDNSALESTEFAGELADGLREGEDYHLVHENVWAKLRQWYGGGPAFPRSVIRDGEAENSLLRVELHPLRFLVFSCDHSSGHITSVPESVPSDDDLPVLSAEALALHAHGRFGTGKLPGAKTHGLPPDVNARIFHCSRGEAYSTMRRSLLRKLGAPVEANKSRLWIKMVPELEEAQEGEDDGADGAAAASAAGTTSGTPPEPPAATRQASLEPEDGTGGDDASASKDMEEEGGQEDAEAEEDEDDGWVLPDLGAEERKTLGELVQGQSELWLMVESRDSPQAVYPRAEILNRWKYKLKVGDLVDAADMDKKWFEAIVREVNLETKKIKVHYKGWTPRWDAELPLDSDKVAKLHTKVPKWRDALDKNDVVELLIPTYSAKTKKKEPRWYEATVLECDDTARRVKLKCDQLVKVEERESNETEEDLDGERICLLGTHIDQRTRTRTTGARSAYSPWGTRGNVKGRPAIEGAVGLFNLGNTCFMNSMLQCLSNTQAITDYFVQSDDYKNDINTDNVLGTKGRLTNAYAKLMRDMWSGKYTTVYPSDLKRTIGDFAPQFAGYQQQDSQELMSFLLDGLHEDLNRVRQKPYVENVEANGDPDEEVAAEQWRRFLLRNDSHFVDHCYGLLRSHVTCKNCNRESVTFDPYLSLSLPIPVNTDMSIRVVVNALPPESPPLELVLHVPLTLNVGEVKRKALAMIWDSLTVVNVPEEDMQAAAAATGSATPASAAAPGSSAAGDEEFVMVSEDDAKSDPDSNNNLPAAPGSAAAERARQNAVLDNVFFHTLVRYSATTRGVRSMDDTTPIRDATRATGGGGTAQQIPTITLVQLEHDVVQTTTGYSRPTRNAQVSRHPTTTVADVVMGIETEQTHTYSYSSQRTIKRIEYLGPTFRMSYDKDTVTNRDVYRKIWAFCRRFVHSGNSPEATAARNLREDMELDEKEAEDLPFEVLQISPSAAMRDRHRDKTIPLNDEKFTLRNYMAVGVLWKEDMVDVDEMDRYIIHESAEQYVAEQRQKKSTGVDINDCFVKFTEREQLGEAELWYCSGCQQHLPPIKKFDIWSLPDVLILHLKRFQYVPGTYFVHREKITAQVDFPVESLDLSEFVIGPTSDEAPPVYDLYGVSEHSGGMGGGHYTAVAQNFRDKKWYSFNDTHVSETTAERGITPRAYCLFYRRRTGALRWGGQVPADPPADGESSS